MRALLNAIHIGRKSRLDWNPYELYETGFIDNVLDRRGICRVVGRPKYDKKKRPLIFCFSEIPRESRPLCFCSSSEGQYHVLQHVYPPSTPSTQGRKFSTRPALVTTFHDTAAAFTSITLLVGDTIQITWSIPCTCP